jgi:phosphoglucosamine mutase
MVIGSRLMPKADGNMNGEFFGTDGIRGKANQYPLTPEMGARIGRAVGFYLAQGHHSAPIIMGRDTRISGQMLEAAVAAGICSTGTDVWLAGTIPTPAVAFLARAHGAAGGVVISASHNPYDDNGIKLFGPDGYKLSQSQEYEIEGLIRNPSEGTLSGGGEQIGGVYPLDGANQHYQRFIRQIMPESFALNGRHLVLDCANGATAHLAPDLFESWGARLTVLFNAPDGININDGCGSEHTATLCQKVIEVGADVGIAFDGDGDRMIAVDETGRMLSGDQILTIGALFLKDQQALPNHLVVSTVMSNLGLGEALQAMGIKHQTCQVGDRFVMAAMRASGAALGGENSGHMIYHRHHTTGDGLISAFKLLQAMQSKGLPLSELARAMTIYPQAIENVPVARKPELESLTAVQEAIHDVEAQLGRKGRVLVRYSGTQPLCRVMVEGPQEEETKRFCRTIADAVAASLGAQ